MLCCFIVNNYTPIVFPTISLVSPEMCRVVYIRIRFFPLFVDDSEIKLQEEKQKEIGVLALSRINKLETMWLMIRLMRENRHYFGKLSTSATTNSRRSYSAAQRASEEQRFSFSNAFRSDTTHLFINFHFDALFIADSSSCDSFNQKFLLFWTRIEYFTFREN